MGILKTGTKTTLQFFATPATEEQITKYGEINTGFGSHPSEKNGSRGKTRIGLFLRCWRKRLMDNEYKFGPKSSRVEPSSAREPSIQWPTA